MALHFADKIFFNTQQQWYLQTTTTQMYVIKNDGANITYSKELTNQYEFYINNQAKTAISCIYYTKHQMKRNI